MTDGRDGDADPTDERLALGDGRVITCRIYGDPAGSAVIALHGTPGSRLKFSGTDAAARRLGLRLIAPDRWGYGGTSVHPTPTLAAFADDVARLCDHFGIDRFGVMGVSGGGPYAAATAARLASRVTALALVSPVGPIAGEDVAMTRFHRFCFGPLGRNPGAVEMVFRNFARLLRASPRMGLAIGMANVPAADRRVLSDAGVRQRLAATFREGLRPGAKGPVIDLGLFSAPWCIPLADARMPARLWLGTADRNVPLAAAQRLADALPACTTETLHGEGHLWVAQHYDEVLAWIARTVADDPLKTSN